MKYKLTKHALERMRERLPLAVPSDVLEDAQRGVMIPPTQKHAKANILGNYATYPISHNNSILTIIT